MRILLFVLIQIVEQVDDFKFQFLLFFFCQSPVSYLKLISDICSVNRLVPQNQLDYFGHVVEPIVSEKIKRRIKA